MPKPNPRLRFQVAPEPDDVVVDNSTMSAVMKCSTLAVVEYGLHLRAKTEGAALTVGQAGHAAMAEWLDTGDAHLALKVYKREYAHVAAPALDALTPDDKDRERLAFPRTRQILRDWFDARPPATWPLVVAAGDTELPVSALLMTLKDGRRVVFVALLDALGKRRSGGLWSIDHKFRRTVTDWWKEKQEDAAQFTGQKWLGGEWGLDLAGVYVNAIELPPPRTGKSKCRDHGVSYFECDMKHLKHELFPVTRSAGEIAAWQRTLARAVPRWVALKERVKTLDDIATVPMEGRFNESCTFCSLRKWCRVGRPSGGRGDWFVEHQWNPLAERRGGEKG